MGISRDFGALLREARSAAGISQEDLAGGADLHRTYISMIERGVRCPTLRVLLAICYALQIKPASIVTSLEERVAKRRARERQRTPINTLAVRTQSFERPPA